MKRLIPLALSLLLPVVVFAQAKVETVLTGLDNPTAVAIQPDTGHVFVAESGAGKVVRIVNGKAEDVVVGSPIDIYGKGPMYNIGPLGIAFQDRDTLVVADGGFKDGEELVRIFTVLASGKPAVTYDKDEKAKAGPIAGKDDIKPEGNLYGVVVTKNAIYVTCNGDDTKGWIARSAIDGTKLGNLERFIATKEAVDVDAPVALAVDKAGNLVVGQMGEIDKSKDALLTFYNAKTGKKLLNLETGLYDLTGVAYSPKTGLLYATDFAWMEAKDGGLFRLDADLKGGEQALKTTKIAPLDKPTAMAFAPDGTLYITVIGTAKDDGSKVGALLKIAPGL